MTSTERIIELCRQKGIAVSRLEKDLGFGNGYRAKKKRELPYDRIKAIAKYLDVSEEFLVYGETPSIQTEDVVDSYYIDPNTAHIAQEIHDNREMRMLFSAAQDVSSETLRELYDMLLILKRREMRND